MEIRRSSGNEYSDGRVDITPSIKYRNGLLDEIVHYWFVYMSHRCAKDWPDVCKGITFRYVDKKRWRGAEGGWENPFPSGNTTVV